MARLLLGTSLKLVFLLAVSWSTPACVLPVSPDFQNPPGAPNAAPEISDPDPFPGPIANMRSQTFNFMITDPNGDQTLYLRWTADAVPVAPPASRILSVTTNSVPPSADGSPQRTPIQETISCVSLGVDTEQSTHQIVAAVADSPFRSDVSNDYLAVEGDGKKSILVWTLTLICPTQASQ